MDERHYMILDKTDATGSENWFCPICGRRMLINWQPQFRKVILEPGDVYAMHSASKGLVPAPADQASVPPDSDVSTDDPRLAPWQSWLDKIDFDNLWDQR